MIGSAFLVLAVLVATTAIAIGTRSNRQLKLWSRLYKHHATDRRRQSYEYRNLNIRLRNRAEDEYLNDFAPRDVISVDAATDESGIWFLNQRQNRSAFPESVLIAWTNVGFVRHDQDGSHIHLFGMEPYELVVPESLGLSIEKRAKKV